jgi:pyruvate kinase
MNYKEFPKDVNPGEELASTMAKLIFEVETNKKTEVVAV